ncbi:MAG: moaA [Deltaproteobacteria bacterium]|nr:moaA [Deltaproteobacteria bacterium]
MTRGPARQTVSLRISVTDRCELRCAYCAPVVSALKVAPEEILSYDEIVRLVRLIKTRYKVTEARLTGGEPLMRPGIERLVAMLAAEGVPDIALTTNGQRLEGVARTLKQAGLNRVNISLDSLNPATFAALSGGGVLGNTLEGVAAALRAGLRPLKLNTVVLRGRNDHETIDLVRFAMRRDCQVRFLELMPIGVAAAGFEDLFVSSEEVRQRLAAEFALAALPVDPEATSRNWLGEDGRGGRVVIGFISPYSEPFCAGCPRLRLTSTGVLIGCLARPDGIPLAPLLRGKTAADVKALDAAVERAFGMKRRDRAFAQPCAMVGIGG